MRIRERLLVGGCGLLLAAIGLGAAPNTLGVATSVTGQGESPPVTLTDVSQTHAWSGEFVVAARGVGVWPAVSLPAACTPELCDFVPLDVQLPDRAWQPRPGGMLVAIRVGIELADLDLHLYSPGCTPQLCAPAASSTALLANEAVWIENPVNGIYTVVVAPKVVAGQPVFGDGALTPLSYDGFVRFQHGLTVRRDEFRNGEAYTREFVAFGLNEQQPVRELLPDLVPTTPGNFEIAFGGNVQGPSCLPTETLGLHDDAPSPGLGPTRCLRFHQGEYNFGDGPFQLNIYEVEDDYEVYQRIYSSDGNVRQIGPLGEVEFSDAHGHFHYLGFQEITLHRIEQDGSLTFVKTKPDKGICVVDVDMGWFGRTDRPTSAPGYPLLSEGYCVTSLFEDPDDPTYPNQSHFEMGMSVGWADIYPSTWLEQYIDITDVLDGDYALVVRQDVDSHILEKSTKNNTAIGCVRLAGDVAEELSCEKVKLPRRTS